MRQVAIAGVGESEYGVVPHLSALQHHADAAAAALDDAGLTLADVDGLFTSGDGIDLLHVVRVAEYLGVRPTTFDGTVSGGSAWETYVEHAALSIAAGRCEVALLVYGSNQRTGRGRDLGTATRGRAKGPRQFEVPYGTNTVVEYALAAQRYLHDFGATPEQLAAVAVATRRHAASNPRAMYRDPITVEDVLASRPIAEPLHLLDCCVISDGGGAVVLTSLERARDLRTAPVRVLGSGSAIGTMTVAQMDDVTDIPARISGQRAFAEAGVGPTDIDVAQLYDSFTITVLLQLEALGICERGTAGAWVVNGGMDLGGALPTNTDGGGLSSNHPGMRGIFLLVEAVRQLRGEADRQVEGAELALCSGTGGLLSTCSTVILGVDR